MNLEQIKDQKNGPSIDDMDFDFKPITSGLGFHHPKATDTKPTITERTVSQSLGNQNINSVKKEMNVYQNDLSLFYGQNQIEPAQVAAENMVPEVKYFRLASKSARVMAYIADLMFVASILSLVLIVMSKSINMDLIEVWGQYPNEITPLVLTLFCGFYLIYFSIFDKSGSTVGKTMFSLRVTDMEDKSLSLLLLCARSFVSLLNFISLGLFSYFDLQNKITKSKVIRID